MILDHRSEGDVMPIHDWTRVTAGIFHHFHHEWITSMSRALNTGRLPPGYYALAEQIAGGVEPDVLALEETSDVSTEVDLLARKRSRIAIRHSSGDKVIAMIEIVSPGNKSSRRALRTFVEKAVDFLEAGIHLLIIDLFPPGRRDPQGIHGVIWSELEEHSFALPADKPLTLAAYSAGALKCAYIEPVAVGGELPDMPLFLEPDRYVPVPLAITYQSAWEGVPQKWQKRLES